MSAVQIGRSGWVRRGMPAVMVLGVVSAAALAGGGQALAAHRGGPATTASAGAPSARGAMSGPATAGVISTFAGGPGGPAKGTTVALETACQAWFGAGSVYIADNRVVRQLNPQTGWLTTPAGNGLASSGGDGGPATSAGFHMCGGTVDHAGNLVIADTVNERIRVVAHQTGTFYGQPMTAGDVYTVAGGGTAGLGDGGPATKAALRSPSGVAVDGAGNLLIADPGNQRIRVVAAATGTFYGQAMTAGYIYTVAGDGGTGFAGDGGPATSAELAGPQATATDGAGNLVIADPGNQRIRVVAAATGTFYGQAMTAGYIYTVAGSGGHGGFSGDFHLAVNARLNNPRGVAVDSTGNLVIADNHNDRVRVVAASSGTFYGRPMTAGYIYTVAGDGIRKFSGDGGPAASAELYYPAGIATQGGGNLLIADFANERIRVVAASTGTLYGQAVTAGRIYTVAGDGSRGNQGYGGPATTAQLNGPEGVAADGAGNLLIADTANDAIRVVAQSTGTFYGQAMTAGDIYGIAGVGIGGYSGDGGPAIRARVTSPEGMTVDGAGNLLVADTGNNVIRVVAESTGTLYGQVMTAGDIYTIAGTGIRGYSGDGGLATHARLSGTASVSVDGAGNVVITDSGNNRIRVVAAATGTFYGKAMTVGDIYTVAGNGTAGFAGDGGPAAAAKLHSPRAVTLDGAGNLVITDSGNNRIRVVAAATGTFYGKAMTAGNIYTVAGDGVHGFAGDGGPATSAELNAPAATAVNGAGNLLISDYLSSRIREVTG